MPKHSQYSYTGREDETAMSSDMAVISVSCIKGVSSALSRSKTC